MSVSTLFLCVCSETRSLVRSKAIESQQFHCNNNYKKNITMRGYDGPRNTHEELRSQENMQRPLKLAGVNAKKEK